VLGVSVVVVVVVGVVVDVGGVVLTVDGVVTLEVEVVAVVLVGDLVVDEVTSIGKLIVG
jgi:hypothetical protein